MERSSLVTNSQYSKKTINVRGRLVDLSSPIVMGILNATPDSFFENSRVAGSDDFLLTKVASMLSDGATILDVGGYSTRPGAAEVSTEEETDRVVAVIESVKRSFPEAILSVDTFRSSVAENALRAGADMINDVSGGSLDELMFAVVAHYQVPYVLMHMRGTPKTMNSLTGYEKLVPEILKELAMKLTKLRQLGVSDVLVDPGFGFAKTVQQNFQLMNQLEAFHQLSCPLLVGISRKTMIYKTLGITADQSLNGTTVLNTIALQKGTGILRVHDVKEAVEAVKLYTAVAGIN
jgi:dihydropteroate synthase